MQIQSKGNALENLTYHQTMAYRTCTPHPLSLERLLINNLIVICYTFNYHFGLFANCFILSPSGNRRRENRQRQHCQ